MISAIGLQCVMLFVRLFGLEIRIVGRGYIISINFRSCIILRLTFDLDKHFSLFFRSRIYIVLFLFDMKQRSAFVACSCNFANCIHSCIQARSLLQLDRPSRLLCNSSQCLLECNCRFFGFGNKDYTFYFFSKSKNMVIKISTNGVLKKKYSYLEKMTWNFGTKCIYNKNKELVCFVFISFGNSQLIISTYKQRFTYIAKRSIGSTYMYMLFC